MRTSRFARAAALTALAAALALSACGEPEPADGLASPAPAPLLGKADGTDAADRACHVVLRELAWAVGATGYETECLDGTCWYVWQGLLDVSDAAMAEGAEAFVLYRQGDGDWWEVPAEPVEGAGGGFQRHAFRLSQHTIAMGLTASAMERVKLQVIPFIRVNGGRYFDHNRVDGDLDTYVLANGNRFAVQDDPAVCRAGDPPVAHLGFRVGWVQEQHGALVAGGRLQVDYDLDRLPDCRGTHNGHPAWDVVAHARFLPGGEEVQATVRAFDTENGTPLPTGHSVPAGLDVPRGAERVELWFENYSGAGSSCRTWDSNLGQNYRFEVLSGPPATVGWAGDLGNGFNRSCAHVAGLPEPMHLGSWELQRACLFIDGDVWIPGLTDAGGPVAHVLAQVEYRVDGGEVQHEWLQFVEDAGNNYRYRWQLSREWLTRNAWQTIEWSFRFSTDGVTWYRVAQGAGPDGGAPRTLLNALD